MKSYLHHCCSWLFLLCFDVFVCDGCVLIKFVFDKLVFELKFAMFTKIK